nr:uncharacterized protein LOC112921216 [Vulpes vulpes]
MAASCFPEGAGDGNCASQARIAPKSSRSTGPLAPNTSLPLLMSRWPAVPGPSHSSGQVQRVYLPWIQLEVYAERGPAPFSGAQHCPSLKPLLPQDKACLRGGTDLGAEPSALRGVHLLAPSARQLVRCVLASCDRRGEPGQPSPAASCQNVPISTRTCCSSCLKKEKKKKKPPLQDPCPASPGCIALLLSGPPSWESGRHWLLPPPPLPLPLHPPPKSSFCATTHLTAPTHKKLAKPNFLGLVYLLCLQLELSRPLAPCAPLSGFPHVVLSWFSSTGSSATWL